MRWTVGDTAEWTVTIDEAVLARFEAVVDAPTWVPGGDEDARVMTTIFGRGRRVVHGPIVTSIISGLLGNKLPGPGSVLLEQQFRFVAPVFVGDTVTTSVAITTIREDKPVVSLDTKAVNQADETVVTGTAVVLHRSVDEWRRLHGGNE